MTTFAERLGYAADARIVVVHADDIGMCHAANTGSFEALAAGPVTCGSLMVPCPWFTEAASRACELAGAVDLGVHLTLTAEYPQYRWGPVAGAPAVPSLVDANGHFPRSFAECAAAATPKDADVELRAQVDRALDSGFDVTHLDSHMGTVFAPQILEVYFQLARDYRLPLFAVRPNRSLLGLFGLNAHEAKVRKLLDDFESDGFPVFDSVDLDSLSFAPGEGTAHNKQRIEGLVPGLNYLVCHPASGGDELSAIAPEAHCRDFERGFYGGEEGRAALEAAGVVTIGMRVLRDLLRSESGG